MKVLIILALLCAPANAEPIGPFVFKVCFPKYVSEDTVIVSSRVSKKKDASLCITVVACDKADFGIYEVESSVSKHYISKDANKCK